MRHPWTRGRRRGVWGTRLLRPTLPLWRRCCPPCLRLRQANQVLEILEIQNPPRRRQPLGGGRDEALLDMREALDGLEGTGNGSDEDASSESSISSDISTTSAYINQQEHLLATSRLVRSTYEAHIKEQGVPFSLCLLLAMEPGN